MRSAVGVFKDASGIFWYDRYKPLIESALNIVLSIPLAVHFGIAGVLLGTIGSTILVPFWFEAYVLFKHYFEKGIAEYMWKQLLYAVMTFLAGAGCFFLCESVAGDGIMSFLLRVVVCGIVPNAVFAIAFCRTEEFKYFWGYMVNFIRKLGK